MLISRKAKLLAGLALSGALIAGLLVPAVAFAQDTLRLEGSTTLQPIAENSEFEFENLATELPQIAGSVGYSSTPGVDMQIFGTGSSAGMKTLLGVVNLGDPIGAPGCHIGMASRDLKSTELAYGVLEDNVVARDGVCMVVYDSPGADPLDAVTQITLPELKNIYEGVFTNWNQIADPNRPTHTIYPRARIVGSGTRDAFLEIIGASPALEATHISSLGLQRMESNKNMSWIIGGFGDDCGKSWDTPFTCPDSLPSADRPYQIGYIGLSYLENSSTYPNLRALAVWNSSLSQFVLPSLSTIQDGTYPVQRGLHMVTRSDCDDPGDPYYNSPYGLGGCAYVDAFIDYMFTTAGQARVNDTSYICVGEFAPNWDVYNLLDRKCNLDDIIPPIRDHWDQTEAGQGWSISKGWCRADITNDDVVNLDDIIPPIRDNWDNGW